MEQYACSICHHFASPTYGGVLRHISSEHSLEPNFSICCGISGCRATYKKFASWRSHIYRQHWDVFHNPSQTVTVPHNVLNDQDELVTTSCDDNDDDNDAHSDEATLPDTKRMAALFILKTRDGRKLTQGALDGIVSDVSQLHQANLDRTYQQLLQVLEGQNVGEEVISAVKATFEDDQAYNLFQGLETEYRQNAYFRRNFGLVDPVERVLGRVLSQTSQSGTTFQNECCYDVPLLQSLQTLLNCDTIIEQIFNPHFSQSGCLEDYCDGSQFKNHPLFSTAMYALQILLYYDDVEVCNPLGSAATTHKLGLFYYTLGNLEPRLRSPTNAIQLVAVVKSSYIDKYGVDMILEPFVEDVKKLESDEGVTFSIEGARRNLRGTLVIGSADNPAAQLMGGYKQLHSAVRKCRDCLAVYDDIQTKFVAEEFQPRTFATHQHHCAALGGPLHDHIATTYGLNRDSILNSLRYFHVTSGLPPDVMHDVLEGSLQLEIKCLLAVLIRDLKLFSLSNLNHRIQSFPYGPDVGDHPKPLPTGCLTGNPMKQSASEAWSLARMLPLLVGDLVPEDNPYWQNFLLMLTITDLVLAPKSTTAIAAHLRQLILEHHTAFKELYPDRPLTPKMHYMVHIPQWIVRCGPLSHLWCMRYEAKHRFFKQIAKVTGSFKNIAKTLAFRHQRYMCYVLASPTRYLEDDQDVGPVKAVHVSTLDFRTELIATSSKVDPNSYVQRTNWVQLRGTKYKQEDCVLLKFDGETPIFAKITGIILPELSEPLLALKLLETSSYSEHFHAYEICQTPFTHTYVICKQADLIDHHTLGIYQPFNSTSTFFVPMKYHVLDEFDV